MTDRSTAKLVRALQEAHAPAAFISAAVAGRFHDYKSPSATPIMDLVKECRRAGLHDIAQRAMDGEFDATKEESDEWARSPEGRAVLAELPPELRKQLE